MLLDDEILKLMVERGTFWCPTLSIYVAGDPEMIKAWQKHLNLGVKPWWKFWQ